jgi:hypothetical protein
MLFKNGLRRLLTGAAAAGLVVSAVAFAGVFSAAGATSVHAEKGPITAKGGAEEAAEFVAGEIIVVFGDNIAPPMIEALVEEVGGEIEEISSENRSRVVVSVPKGKEEEYIDAYLQLGAVLAAEKNYILSTQPESTPATHKTSISE